VTALELTAKLNRMVAPIHGFIYFAPEATEEYEALHLPASHHYFASRAAALGSVPAEVVVATFFNFPPFMVEVAIPDAWSIASPAAIQTARMRAAGRALRTLAGPALDADDIAEASALTRRIIDGIEDAGRPLAAGNRAVPEPEDAWERLWQRITILREWRGDVHIAALVAAAVDPVEALLLHAATGQLLQSTRSKRSCSTQPPVRFRSQRSRPPDRGARRPTRRGSSVCKLADCSMMVAPSPMTAERFARRSSTSPTRRRSRWSRRSAPSTRSGSSSCCARFARHSPMGAHLRRCG